MEETTQTNLENLESKFTKAHMYAVIKELIDGNTELTLDEVAAAVKPQKGGGASANPSKEIDGVTHHWCRYKGEYVPEELMNMSAGKSKGTSILASKIAYRITKAVDELKAGALAAFTSGDYEAGANKNAEADELAKTIEDTATFTDEAMVNSIYHPDFGKEVKEDTADNAEVI